jgi:hypothetical protein
MKYLVTLLAVLFSCQKETPLKEAPMNIPSVDSSWMELGANSLFQLRAEKALFAGASQPHFFVHFQVTNLTQKKLAIDLRDKWLPVHPNQWGFSQTEQRQVIDESRMTRPPFTDEVQREVIAAYQSGALSSIGVGERLDFYVEFNASGHKDVDAKSDGSPFLIVSLDGELVATDGAQVERFSLIESFDTTKSDLTLTTPILWKELPSGALLHLR